MIRIGDKVRIDLMLAARSQTVPIREYANEWILRGEPDIRGVVVRSGGIVYPLKIEGLQGAFDFNFGGYLHVKDEKPAVTPLPSALQVFDQILKL